MNDAHTHTHTHTHTRCEKGGDAHPHFTPLEDVVGGISKAEMQNLSQRVSKLYHQRSEAVLNRDKFPNVDQFIEETIIKGRGYK